MKIQICLLLTISVFSCASHMPQSPTQGLKNDKEQRARYGYIKSVQDAYAKCQASKNPECAELFDNFAVVINSQRKS